MRQKILLLALLCAVAQGALAQNFDVWDGTTKTRPASVNDCFQINTAAELAYIAENFTNYISSEETNRKCFYQCNYSLNADLDMTAGNWESPGNYIGTIGHTATFGLSGTFDGNGHTIRIKIRKASLNF